MSTPASDEAVRTALDRALGAPNGVRVTLPTSGAAVNFRQRCYKVRAYDRRKSKTIYPVDDPQFDTSPYDALTIATEGPLVIINRPPAPQIEEI